MKIVLPQIVTFLIDEVYKLVLDKEPSSDQPTEPLQGFTTEPLTAYEASDSDGTKQNTYRVWVKLDQHLTPTAIVVECVPTGEGSKATYEVGACTLEIFGSRPDIDKFFHHIQEHVADRLTVVYGTDDAAAYFMRNEVKHSAA